jgi:diaminopimelate decarboxylase
MIETRANVLHLGGIPVTAIVQKHGDPLYVYDGEVIERQVADLRMALPYHVEIIYSMKANPTLSIVGLLREMTDGVDVSSGRELQTALHAGFAPEQIFFVGPSKSEEELHQAVSHGIGCLVVESQQELETVDRIAAGLGKIARVAVRVNPAFDAVGSKLKMGGTPRQFGIDEEQCEGVLVKAKSLSSVTIVGLHAYVGTRILDWTVAVRNTREILALTLRMHERTGTDFEVVDVGGGLGVPYFPTEDPFDLKKFGENVSPVFNDFSARMPATRVVMELGRFLVAESGIYVTKVRYIKRSRGQTYVLVSGGMNHHQATTSIGSLVKSHFPIRVLEKMESPTEEPVFVCGPLCTPGDVLGRSVELPLVREGDLIGILNSGAYGMTASPLEFLSHNWPTEVLIHKGRDYVIRTSPKFEDMLKCQPLITLNAIAV